MHVQFGRFYVCTPVIHFLEKTRGGGGNFPNLHEEIKGPQPQKLELPARNKRKTWDPTCQPLNKNTLLHLSLKGAAVFFFFLLFFFCNY
jgi:hypothetical protein